MKELNPTDLFGQNVIKLISNVCFSVFVFSVLIFSAIAITYQPPDPWESSRALTKVFTDVENATFQTDSSVLKTGEDIAFGPVASPVGSVAPITESTIEKSEEGLSKNGTLKSGCEDVSLVNCSDPRVLIAIQRFNLRTFKAIVFLEYQTPVNGSKPDECDVSWRFRNRKERSWRRYRDFRRFKIGFKDDCSYKVIRTGRWHSGVNARKQGLISSRSSTIVRPKRTSRGCSERSGRKQSVKAMRAVVQRVASASVEVEGRLVSAIGPGLLVLVGLHETDADSDAEYICRKVLNMRLFPNEKTGKTWDQSVMQKHYEVLLVSQFTLYGVLKGNKPDFHVAMPPDAAKSFYASLVERLQKTYRADSVKDGVFGAMMKVNLVNDGPVTMQLDSRQSSKNTNGDETTGNVFDVPGST